MVDNHEQARLPGRPRSFDPDEALDCAVDLFWADGFEGVDVERIARAAGVTKPSLYRLFGDKSALFMQALQRYGATEGAKPLTAFTTEPDIAKAVLKFFEAAVRAGTAKGRPSGCLLACVAAGEAERSAEIRKFYAQALAGMADTVTRRFEEEMQARRLSSQPSARTRAHLMVDIVQGVALRARAGARCKDLLEDVRSYVSLVVG